ncbi:MAG: carbohydrate ABC transporter permease [Christensenellales bacterium]
MKSLSEAAYKNGAIKTSMSRQVFVICNTFFLILLMFTCFYPFYYVFIQSLSGGIEGTKALIWPINFTLKNYTDMLAMPEIGHAFLISVARTVIGSIGHVMCCMIVGYLFTKETMPFRKVLYRFVIVTMYVSGGMIPTYLVMRSYGLLNTFWVYVLPGLLSAYDIILVKTFVESISKELEESAKIDGASTMRIFFKIILPLSLPIAATLTIFTASSQWNSWFDNNLYTITNKNLTTLQFLLYQYLNQAEKILEQIYNDKSSDNAVATALESQMTTRGIKMTVTMISVIPIMCVYPFMQRYLIKGIMIGAVKG